MQQARRKLLVRRAAGGAAISPCLAAGVYAAGSDVLKVALVGCGGRGAGAASQILQTKAPVKLWAMADAFPDKVESAFAALSQGQEKRYDRAAHGALVDRIDVPPDRRFAGFEAYKAAIDSGVDIVILATSPHFRPMQFAYAVERGVHAFVEKPVAVDSPGARLVLAAGEEAKKKQLKVGVGLMRRHNRLYQETLRRIHAGALGQIKYMRTYFNHAAMWTIPRQPGWSEMEYQMRNWEHFLWLSGDHNCEQQAHSTDIILWTLGRPPRSAQGMGGRQVQKGPAFGDVFDHHSIEFTWDDEVKAFAQCRQIDACWTNMTEHVHGVDGYAQIDRGWIEGRQRWRYRGDVPNPYQVEQDVLVGAVINDTPHNEAEYGALGTLMAIMGRMATYSGQVVTWDQVVNSPTRCRPIEYSMDVDPPVLPAADGSYEHAVPMPGVWRV